MRFNFPIIIIDEDFRSENASGLGIRALAAAIDGIRQRHGKLSGVVHGAGVIEDKLLEDKTPDSWMRVVGTKVLGMLLLQKLVRVEELQYFCVFSSVAGDRKSVV